MATELTHGDVMEREQETTMEVVASGSIAEAIGGIGAVVLAVFGLAGLLPQEMAAIATMAVGMGLLLEGLAVGTRLSDLLSESEKNLSDVAKLGGGTGVDFLGGVAGGMLGLLAILDIVPLTLMAIAVIVFGACLLLSSGATYRLDLLANKLGQKTSTTAQALVAAAASGVQVLIGIAGIALGIIALVGISPLILILVGLLSVGAAVLISGSAVTGTIASVMRR